MCSVHFNTSIHLANAVTKEQGFNPLFELIPSVWPFAAKLIIISNNTPPIKKSEIEYYAMLSKTGVHHYSGSELPAFWFLPACWCTLQMVLLLCLEECQSCFCR
jgi:hypothetical protein